MSSPPFWMYRQNFFHDLFFLLITLFTPLKIFYHPKNCLTPIIFCIPQIFLMTFFRFFIPLKFFYPLKITPPILDADWPFWMFNSIGIIYMILVLGPPEPGSYKLYQCVLPPVGATHYPNFQTYTSKKTTASGSSFFRTLCGNATQSELTLSNHTFSGSYFCVVFSIPRI